MQQLMTDISNPREVETIEALTDDDWQVRTAAATEVEVIGARVAKVVPVLIKMLVAECWVERRAAADALVAITGQSFGQDALAWQRWWRGQCLRCRDSLY
jgi:HEAT repeat protein